MGENPESPERDERDQTEDLGVEEDLELSDEQTAGISGGMVRGGEEEEIQT